MTGIILTELGGYWIDFFDTNNLFLLVFSQKLHKEEKDTCIEKLDTSLLFRVLPYIA